MPRRSARLRMAIGSEGGLAGGESEGRRAVRRGAVEHRPYRRNTIVVPQNPTDIAQLVTTATSVLKSAARSEKRGRAS